MKIGTREFAVQGKTYLMGILNVTPDSFSDGGRWNTPDAALFRAEQLCAEGADILDIGGESTRPGYTRISDAEEIDRVAPVIEKIHARFDVPISLDTYKSAVARAGLDAGADMINDIWGLKADPALAGVIAERGVPCCLMHNRKEARYGLFFVDLLDDLKESIRIAENAGIPREKLILDPGVGFAKSYEQNLECIRRLPELVKEFHLPVLLGVSRKSVIGETLRLPVGERLEGTLAATALAVSAGCMFVRVHDAEANRRVIRMAEAICYGV